jgi:hypothetical protein
MANAKQKIEIKLPPRRHVPQGPLAVHPSDLRIAGVARHKIPRVMAELQRAADATPALNTRSTLMELGRSLARYFW